ncbi:MAG: hypothetical protein ACKVS5_15175 [Parvularculaceae bacterium]
MIFAIDLPKDARWFQIAAQSIIIAVGLIVLDFRITSPQIAAAIGAALAAQGLCSALFASRFDWKSAAITGLSLCLLLRANDIWPFVAAAAIGVGSKFALRRNGRHVFNPANIGIIAILSVGVFGAGSGAWTSTGEWGSAAWLALMIACLGAITCWRASRLDAALIYLCVYATLVLGRALYLGDPIEIASLRLTHGALVLFAFFMISDPKTTPEDPRERALFVGLAALFAYVLQFHFFVSDGIFLAPFVLALARFILLRPNGPAYQWGREPAPLRLAAEKMPAIVAAE